MSKFPLLVLAIFVLCFSAFPALASDCTAPIQLYRVSGPAPDKRFAISIAGVGDLNGDGVSDFIVGAANTSPNGISAAGTVFVYSGSDGAYLYQIDGKASADYLGQSVVGIGDVNNDGKPDFIVAASTYASVYSGLDSVLLSTIGLPTASLMEASFATAGDVNGDGKLDILIGVPSASTVFIHSIIDDSLLYQINGSGQDQFGYSVAGIGDVDEDGYPDFIVGAPGADTVGSLGNIEFGAVFVYSGIDGTLLHEVRGTHLWEYLGFSVTTIRDWDGDGKKDFIASGPLGTNSGYFFGPPYAKAFSSVTGELLFEKTSSDSTSAFGYLVKKLADVNGDGISDFIVSAPGGYDNFLNQHTDFGAVYIFSGSDTSLIYQVKSPVAFDYFGLTIAELGDLDGNGKTDILIGAPEDSPQLRSTHPGSVYVIVSKTVPKGDLNFDSTLTIADVTNLLNVAFIDNSAAISPCTADLNCDGAFSPADIILLLNRVFLQTALPCS